MSAFRSTESALGWSFSVVASQIASYASFYPQAGGRRPRSTNADLIDLSEHERHAQAAAVLRRVDELPDRLGAVLRAWYGMDPAACDHLAGYLSNRVGGATPEVYGLMVRNFVRNVSGDAQVRRALRCGKPRAMEIRKEVYGLLSELYGRAYGLVDDALRESGLVGE